LKGMIMSPRHLQICFSFRSPSGPVSN